jgi:FMN-dependent oxidoreductase (nitrilotriacetate monooxygenase family)
MPGRQLHFNAFIWPAGYHESAWRVVPDDPLSVLGLPYYAEIARTAERGLLDTLFLADNMAIPSYRAQFLPQTQFDPVEVLATLAGLTERIGLVATGSTTYSSPWDLARRFATLDFLSAGRAAWNIVTTGTPLTAANFGTTDHPSHADRYARAHEFVEVVQKVWDGWEDDALVGDKAAGVWADRSKLHPPDHRGEHFSVAGYLPFPRSPQGHPVLVQAGSSPAGIALAARYAELVFTGQPTLGDAVSFRRELRAQVAAAGRRPDDVFVLPGLTFVLAPTETEALARRAELEELASPELRWRNLLYVTGLDPDAFDPDAPLPAELLDGPPPTSGAARLFERARGRDVPLRELALETGGTPAQSWWAGTPQQLADHIEEWFRAGAVDGFTLMASTLPYGLTTFVDEVVPLLQRRGLFRTEYTGSTLRDHLGLERPRNRHEVAARA